MKKFFHIALVFLMSIALMGARVADDEFKIGKPGSASDKVIKFGDNFQIKGDEASSKMQFSNDGGTNFSNMGSGSGGAGGVNLLENFDFESGVSGYEATGAGTLAEETTSPAFGAKSAKWDAALTTEYFQNTPAVSVPVGLQGKTCQVRMKYLWASGVLGDIKFQVYDGTDVLVEKEINPVTEWTEDFMTFTCAEGASTLQFRLESTTNAAEITLDDLHLGSETNQIKISQSTLYGSLDWNGASSSCAWSITGNVVDEFPVDSDCNTPTASGKANAPGTKIPEIQFAYLPVGTYKVMVSGVKLELSGVSTGVVGYGHIYDGATEEGHVTVSRDNVSNVESKNLLVGNFTYAASQSNVRFRLRAFTSDGSETILLHNQSGGKEDMKIHVYYYPTEGQDAVSVSQSGWHVDAEISGTGPAMGTSTIASYSPLNASALTLTQRSGSHTVGIACPDGEASSGTTCSGSENFGISFTVPRAGKYQACSGFTHSIDTTSTGGGDLTAQFKMVETANDDTDTELQDGGMVLADKARQNSNAGSFNAQHDQPFTLCGIFSFSSAGEKTIRVYGKQQVSGTMTASDVYMNPTSFTVFPLTNIHQQTILKENNQVVSPDVNGVRIASAEITFPAGVPTIQKQDGSWISTVDDNGTGDVTINFTAGTFSLAPICFPKIVEAFSGSTVQKIATIQTAPSSSSVDVVTYSLDTSALHDAAADQAFNIFCVGAK